MMSSAYVIPAAQADISPTVEFDVPNRTLARSGWWGLLNPRVSRKRHCFSEDFEAVAFVDSCFDDFGFIRLFYVRKRS